MIRSSFLLAATLLWLPSFLSAQTTEFGNLTIVQNDATNTAASITLTKGAGSSPNFSTVGGNRGDFDVSLLPGILSSSGVAIPCVSELSRDNTAKGDTIGRFYATASYNPKEATSNISLSAFSAPAGDEVNINLAFGFFPFSRWIGGVAQNTANNGELTQFIGTSGLVRGTNFIDLATPAGQYTVSINTLAGGNASQNGVLLVTGAKNEDNYALSKANADGTFTLYCHDNGVDSTDYENDGVGFVYLPVSKIGTDRLTAIGRVNGNATLDVSANAPGKTITVTKGTTGIWYLKIAGESASTGTLLVSPEGGVGNNADNIVSYGWDAANSRWVIESRDLPASPPSLQNAAANADDVFSFAFFSAPILPSATLTSPAPASTAMANASFTLEATATDADGTVTKLEFLRNGAAISTQTSAPYAFTDTGLPAGHYDYQVRATDNDGNVFTSAVTQVVVTLDPAQTLSSSALSFDGTNDHVTMGAAPGLNVGKIGDAGFTLECWFRREGSGITANSGSGGVVGVPLFGKGRGESDGSNVDCNIFFGINTTGLLVADFEAYPATGVAAGENFPITATHAPITNNVWNHAAVTYDHASSTWKLYLNGVQVGSSVATANARPRYDSIQHFGIGTSMSSTGSTDGAFRGRIDEARVWNYARSTAEITAAKDHEIPTSAGLIGRFGLNEGTGTTTSNSAGSEVGVLTNGPMWVQGASFNAPNLPPSVELTQPLNDAYVVRSNPLSLEATAADVDGSIAKVEFLVNGISVGEDATAPYAYAWTPTVAGHYAISARVSDNSGATAVSNAVTIQVIASANHPVMTGLSPVDGSAVSAAAATLQANVTDPNGDAMTVTFYGRHTTPATPGPDFSLIQIPDTQFYSEGAASAAKTITIEELIGTFGAQTQWIVQNKTARNIAFVSHMGDIVQRGNNDGNDIEWQRASSAMSKLENPVTTLRAHGMPYGLAPGNHDMDPIGDYDGGSKAYFNQFFGTNRFAGRTYWGGNYGSDNTNNYQLFSASGLDFIAIHLAYDTTPNQAIMNWADTLMKAHPHRRAIVTSHSIIGGGNPANFSAQGQGVYDALKGNPNFFLMLCGHIHAEGRRADVYQGRTVYSVLSDYQGAINGGSGFLRILNFSPANNSIKLESYSPTLGRAINASDSIPSWEETVTLPYNMQQPLTGWMVLGTATVPAGGTVASLPWSGLEAGRNYEWYAAISDGMNTGSSTVRRFTAATAIPPTVTLDTPANGGAFQTPLTLNFSATAADADGSVARVEFYSDGVKLGEDTTAPYTFDWVSVPAGTYHFSAVAVDNSNIATLSDIATVTVAQGDQFPVVSLTNPVNGSAVPAPADLTLRATASDVEGPLTKVEFFSGTTEVVFLGEDTVAPYTLDLSGLTTGVYTFTARATDNAGQTTTSEPVSVSVFVEAPLPNTTNLSVGAFDPPAWTVTRTRPSPRHFNQPGTAVGDIELKIAGVSVPFNNGITMTSNWNSPATVLTNVGSQDNLSLPYANTADNVVISVLDSTNDNAPGSNPGTSKQTSGVNVAFLPYTSNWTGARVNAASTVLSGNLPAGVKVSRAFAPGAYSIDGLSTAGTLLAFPNGDTGAQADNISFVRVENGRWVVGIRDNSGKAQNGDFSFVYVPPNTTGVYAAAISRAGVISQGNAGLTGIGANAVVTPDGVDITFGDGTVINPTTAALFICGDSTIGAQNGPASNNLISWSANGNSFRVFTQDVTLVNGVNEAIDLRVLAIPYVPVSTANVVTITATDASAGEHGLDQSLNFTISRSGGVTAALVVPLSTAGSATAGADYSGFQSSVIIPASQSSISLPLTVIPDSLAEGAETLTISVQSDPAFIVGTPASATATIADHPGQQWYLTQISDPTKRGAGDDADNDGVPNILEYFMGTQPENSSSTATTAVTTDGQAATFSFRRALGRDGANGVVEWSSDLSHWYQSGQSDGSLTVNIAVSTTSAPGDDPQIMHGVATNAAGDPLPAKIFFRLKVSE